MGRCEEIIGNGRVDFPIGENQVVPKMLGIVEVNRVEHSRQFVFRADPHLCKDSIACKSYDVSGNASNDCGLADTISVPQPRSHVAIRVRDDDVGKGKVDPR